MHTPLFCRPKQVLRGGDHRGNYDNGRTDKVIRRKQFINMQLTQKTAMFNTKGFTSAEVETFLGSLYLGELEREEGRDVIGLAGNKLLI